jgi:hypothetical protein
LSHPGSKPDRRRDHRGCATCFSPSTIIARSAGTTNAMIT